jgi:5-methylcytosine-specific restriction protein B
LSDIAGAIFPRIDAARVRGLLEERRFVILEGPPGTGKTRLAFQIADSIGSSTRIQFHPARTYEDFVVGLFPRPAGSGIAFEVRAGDFLRANAAAQAQKHVLVIDEVNRADLARVLGEAIVLLEPAEAREIDLPHAPDGHPRSLRLSKNLLLLGTRNTADRTVARIDVAIRRRFAFLEMWPDRDPVSAQNDGLAKEAFDDVVHTFSEFADDEALRLVPGHAYFLDPETTASGRTERIAHRLRFELLPLLRDYVSEKLCGNATEEISGLADRIQSRLLALEN